jgi:hypothetical protein
MFDIAWASIGVVLPSALAACSVDRSRLDRASAMSQKSLGYQATACSLTESSDPLGS